MQYLTLAQTVTLAPSPSYLAKSEATGIPGIPMEALGQFPILQFVAGLMTLMIFGAALLLWLKARLPKDEQPAANPFAGNTVDATTAIYFTGPLKAIFEGINDIKARQLLNRLETKDDFAGLLSDQRRQIQDVIERSNAADLQSRTAAEARVTDNINAVHERIDDVAQSLVTISGKVDAIPKRRT